MSKDDATFNADAKGPSDKDAAAVPADQSSITAGNAGASPSVGANKATSKTTAKANSKPKSKADAGKPAGRKKPWFGWFRFLLTLTLFGLVGYYWFLQEQVALDNQKLILDLQQQIDSKASHTKLDSSMKPMRAEIGNLSNQISQLNETQDSLQDANQKLYDLYGRDRNEWQLAEVEYLLRVAQHKLVLQDDFEGSAITLQAASDLIAGTGDPGLLPVRVGISNEIAELKTRRRPDLVGMTLILSQLGRQLPTLKPGFAVRVDQSVESNLPVETEPEDKVEAEAITEALPQKSWQTQFSDFVDSLVKVSNETTAPSQTEANTANVSEALEENLKLARWAVLERDNRQYQELIDKSLQLFRQFYDLDNAVNGDFFNQLGELQKMELMPEKPDISGSYQTLQRILARQQARQQVSPLEAGSNNADSMPKLEGGSK